MEVSDERRTLRESAYVDPSKLQARQRLWTYAERVWDKSRIEWALPLQGDEIVVDIGCGNGTDISRLRHNGHRGCLIGIDFSPGMLTSISGDVGELVVGDAMAVPIADDCADVVCAMHMLYHVPDITAALREARRVLHQTGVFLASTNSEHAARELIEPWSEALVDAGAPPLARVSHQRFSLERGGAILGSVFSEVEMKPIEITARVPSPDVIRDYVASTDDLYRAQLPNDQVWQQVVADVTEHARLAIERNGTFDITQRAGVFICRN